MKKKQKQKKKNSNNYVLLNGNMNKLLKLVSISPEDNFIQILTSRLHFENPISKFDSNKINKFKLFSSYTSKSSHK